MSRFDEAWQEYSCADCDPTLPGMEDSEYEKPYVILVPEGTDAPDICPRCSSYLGFCEGAKDLQITNTPEQRWAAKQKEAQHE
jgi:hypothetical protein